MTELHYNSITNRPPMDHAIRTYILDLISCTFSGHQYLLICTKHHTRYKLTYLLTKKSYTEKCILETLARVERYFSHNPIRIRCDNANEFITKLMCKVTAQTSVNLDPTTVHTLKENTLAECTNRTLMRKVRATLTV